MFHMLIEKQYDGELPIVTLVARCPGWDLLLSPEESENIIGETPDEGELIGTETSGHFRLWWDEEAVTIELSKPADGVGAGIVVRLARANDPTDSFAAALAEWQRAYE